ncbi:TPA: hypothetical protein U2B98_001669 [Streptococcus suis]|nr:hypothetical protein [Streptococcus suis]HEM6265776.1 hypothetical protein [Streptococcus suis]HEM6320675.1 hypothetical protein [Streptococcus suis]
MFDLIRLLIPIGIIYLVVKYDKKRYVYAFFCTCIKMLGRGIWGALCAIVSSRNKVIDSVDDVVVGAARNATDFMTSSFWGRFRNNVDWAMRDNQIRQLEKDVAYLRQVFKRTGNPDDKARLKAAEASLRKAKDNRI